MNAARNPDQAVKEAQRARMTALNRSPAMLAKRGSLDGAAHALIVAEITTSDLTYAQIGKRWHLSAKWVGLIARKHGIRRYARAL